MAELPGSDFYFARETGFSDLPLGSHAVVSSNGQLIYYGQTDDAAIKVMDLQDRKRRTFRVRLDRPQITAAAWERAKAERIEREPMPQTRKLLTSVLMEAPAPKTHPLFSAIRADRVGFLWIRLPTAEPAATWSVYRPDGVHVASVTLPSNVELFDIGEDHIVGVERDELDVEYVVLYTLGKRIPRSRS